MQGDYCPCAYLGVPQSHWLANMDTLEFDCHWGLTFRGTSSHAELAGFYWFGWDYGHAGDLLTDPGQKPGAALRHGKRWTAEEIEHDIVDVAVALQDSLSRAIAVALNAVTKASATSTDSLSDGRTDVKVDRGLSRGPSRSTDADPA